MAAGERGGGGVVSAVQTIVNFNENFIFIFTTKQLMFHFHQESQTRLSEAWQK